MFCYFLDSKSPKNIRKLKRFTINASSRHKFAFLVRTSINQKTMGHRPLFLDSPKESCSKTTAT